MATRKTRPKPKVSVKAAEAPPGEKPGGALEKLQAEARRELEEWERKARDGVREVLERTGCVMNAVHVHDPLRGLRIEIEYVRKERLAKGGPG